MRRKPPRKSVEKIGGQISQQSGKTSQQAAEGGRDPGYHPKNCVGTGIFPLTAYRLQGVIGQGLLGTRTKIKHEGLESHGHTKSPNRFWLNPISSDASTPHNPGGRQRSLAPQQVRSHAAGESPPQTNQTVHALGQTYFHEGETAGPREIRPTPRRRCAKKIRHCTGSKRVAVAWGSFERSFPVQFLSSSSSAGARGSCRPGG